MHGCHRRSIVNRRATLQLRRLLTSWYPRGAAARRQQHVVRELDALLDTFPHIELPLLEIRGRR